MIPTRANYEQREDEARITRVEPYSLFLLNPDHDEVLRSFTAIAEMKPRIVTANQRAGGVEFSWTFKRADRPCSTCSKQASLGHDQCYACRTTPAKRNCKFCDRPIMFRRLTARYCTRACKMAFEAAMGRETYAIRACAICGTEIEHSKRSHSRYCGARCRTAAFYRDHAEEKKRKSSERYHARRKAA